LRDPQAAGSTTMRTVDRTDTGQWVRGRTRRVPCPA
jgi:hypothetical protein